MNKRAQTFSVKAEGNSMYPLLQNGDRVEYIQVPFSAINLNDIILVYDNAILFTHRVIYKTKKTCITRGDNNPTADTPIRKKRILAKVRRFERKGVRHDIQDVYFAQSTFYLNEIQKLEILLTLKKIPHVFLKGVLVSLRYEGAIPKRIYADCDLLIERINDQMVKKIFSQLGYREIRQWNFTNKIIPEINFIKVINGMPVVFDLHFEPHFLSGRLGDAVNCLYPFSHREKLTKTIIDNSQNLNIYSNTYSLPSPPMQIVALALHIFHHNFTDSIRYQLLDAVIRKSATKKMWADLQKVIIEYRLQGYVYGVVLMLKKYFNTPTPHAFLKAICPSRFKMWITRYLISRIDIFSQESRIKEGIKRFFFMFLFSPEPGWKKISLFIHPEVIYTGFMSALSLIDIFQKKLMNMQYERKK